MPLSNAQKLVILRLIEERKSILFGKFKNSQSGTSAKEKAWKEIVEKCVADYGFDATSGNDWKYLRGTTWPNWKRDTKNKVDENSKTGNEGGKESRLSEVNEAVLNIIGRQSASMIGLNAPEQWTENGFDLFHDEEETSDAVSSISESQQSVSIRRGSMTTTNRAEVPRRSNTAAMAPLQILDQSDSRSSSSTIQVVIAGRGGQSTTFARPQTETSSTRRPISPAFSTQHSLIQVGEQATIDFNESLAGPSGFMPLNSPPPSSSKKTRKRPASSSINAFGFSDELREERLKNLKLHNQLIEVQIDYIKLKMRALQAELEKPSIDSVFS